MYSNCMENMPQHLENPEYVYGEHKDMNYFLVWILLKWQTTKQSESDAHGPNMLQAPGSWTGGLKIEPTAGAGYTKSGLRDKFLYSTVILEADPIDTG